jgi:hypothetical protein
MRFCKVIQAVRVIFSPVQNFLFRFAETSANLGVPMIATTRYDGSRPPIPIDRDQFEGAVGHSW